MIGIGHIDQLLALDDVAFVEALYVGVLGRRPDSEEMKFYVNQLRAGYGKARMITDVAKFPDASAGTPDLPGLPGLIGARRRLRSLPWGLLTRVRGMERQLNRLENGIGQLLQQLTRLENETRQQMSALERPPQLAADNDGELNANPVGLTESAEQSPTFADEPRKEDSAAANIAGLSKAARQILQKISDELEAARGETFN